MGAGHQKDRGMIRSLEFSSPFIILQRGGARNGSCLSKEASIKSHCCRVQRVQVGEHIHTGRVTHLNSMDTGAPAPGTLADHALCMSSSGHSSVSFVILLIKLVNVSRHFTDFCEVLWKIN